MVGIIKAGLWWWITNELERIFNHYVFLLCLTSITDNSQKWKGYSICFQLGVQMRSIWEYNLFSNIYTPHQTSETFSWTNCIKTPGYDLSYIGSAGKYQDCRVRQRTKLIRNRFIPLFYLTILNSCYGLDITSKKLAGELLKRFSELSRICTSWQTTSYEFSMAKFPRR